VKGIVFVPGISGSEIIFRNEAPPIWPPKWNDFPTYQEMDELCDPTEDTVGNVIDTVAGLYPVYQTTENDLQNISATINGVANGPYLPAPYDWRIDLLTVVDDVANKIEAFANSSGMTDITIVSHSMGDSLRGFYLNGNTRITRLHGWRKSDGRYLSARLISARRPLWREYWVSNGQRRSLRRQT